MQRVQARRFSMMVGVAVCFAALAATVAGYATAAAEEPPVSSGPSGPASIVGIGDSYLSGEAAGDYVEGTDSDTNRCHRSLHSLVVVAAATHPEPRQAYNLACSGATTADLRRYGTERYGERPQVEQLRRLAEQVDVRTVVVSIGGNDIGFGGMIRDCVASFLPLVDDCHPAIDAALPTKLAEVQPQIGAVLDDVAAALAEAGYPLGHTDVVLLSYPSPVTEKIRSPWLRLAQGCPFTLADLAYARTGLTPAIAAAWAEVAAVHGARFLDVSRAFEGHEVCARGATFDTEWAKGIFVNTAQISRGLGTHLVSQSMHPNQAGHAALGGCLAAFLLTEEARAQCVVEPDRPDVAIPVALPVGVPAVVATGAASSSS